MIHVAAAIAHLSEYVPAAIFFVALASFQFAWGVAVYRMPSRRILSIGAGVSLAVVALWVISRTSGIPLGPERWTAEEVGPLDLICTADETLLALLALFPLRFTRPGLLLRVARPAAMVTALGLLLISSLALTVAGQTHVH
jgi:hypothetical protein